MDNLPIDRSWLEEKLAHIGTIIEERLAHVCTKLEHILQRQDTTDQAVVRCQASCNSQLGELYAKVNRNETATELNTDWRKREERKAAELPHWAHAGASWAKVVLVVFGGIVGAVVTFFTMYHK